MFVRTLAIIDDTSIITRISDFNIRNSIELSSNFTKLLDETTLYNLQMLHWIVSHRLFICFC